MAAGPPLHDLDCFLVLRNGNKVPITYHIPSPDSLERKIEDDLQHAKVQKKLIPKFTEDEMDVAVTYIVGFL